MATYQPMASTFTLKPDPIVQFARDAGALPGPAAWLPNSTVWGGLFGQPGMAAQLASNMPAESGSFDPTTNKLTLSPQTMSTLDKSLGMMGPLGSFARSALTGENNVLSKFAKFDAPQRQTFPLPVPRPPTPPIPTAPPAPATSSWRPVASGPIATGPVSDTPRPPPGLVPPNWKPSTPKPPALPAGAPVTLPVTPPAQGTPQAPGDPFLNSIASVLGIRPGTPSTIQQGLDAAKRGPPSSPLMMPAPRPTAPNWRPSTHPAPAGPSGGLSLLAGAGGALGPRAAPGQTALPSGFPAMTPIPSAPPAPPPMSGSPFVSRPIPPPPPTVQIASGKTVPVGTTGTAQGGRYSYSVMPDGSILNTTTGRITSPATLRSVAPPPPPPAWRKRPATTTATSSSAQPKNNGIGTYWDKKAGAWV
jgi:hypothetical protein